jgi:type II secretory pathway component PulC
VSLFRAIGPAAFGGLFGWSTNNGLSYPFNAHFMFVVACLIGIICLILMYAVLDTTINMELVYEENEVPLLDKTNGINGDKTKFS